MSATLRSLIQSAWNIASPLAPVYVSDPATPANSFLAAPPDWSNLEGESGKTYPLCLVWDIVRTPEFTKSGYIANLYKVSLCLLDQHNPTDANSSIQSKIDALRQPCDELLRLLHINDSVSGVMNVNISEVRGQDDDNLCGYRIDFRIEIDEETITLCAAPELLPDPEV